MGIIKRNERNKPTIGGIPVPDMVNTSKLYKETGLGAKDVGAGILGLGLIAAGAKAIKDTKKKTSTLKPPPSKPKFSNVQVPVGKPPKNRKPQTLKGGGTESQTFTKKERPGRSKKETVKVNVVN